MQALPIQWRSNRRRAHRFAALAAIVTLVSLASSGCVRPAGNEEPAQPPASAPATRGIGGLVSRNPEGDEGRALLAQGEFDRAVIRLQAATERQPDDARAWEDLTTALLARSEARFRPEDLLEALAASERALRLEPDRQGAASARARVLKLLFLDSATESGGEGGPREPVAPALESAARNRDAEAVEALLTGNPDAAREFVESGVIRSWTVGEAEVDDATWQSAGFVAATLSETTGERYPSDALETVRRSAASPTSAASLREGLEHYFAARDLHSIDELERAGVEFQEALATLPDQARPFDSASRLMLAIYDYQAADLDGSARKLGDVVAAAENREYLALGGQAQWMFGLINTRRSEANPALRHYRQARVLFQRARDRGRLASVDMRIADVYRQLGDRREEWRYSYRALGEMEHVRRAKERQNFYLVFGITALEQGYPEAAVHFHDAALAAARAENNAAQIVQSEIWRALTRHELGQGEAALSDLRASRHRLAEVSRGWHEPLEAEWLVAEGRLCVDSRPAEAVELLTKAESYFLSSKADARLGEIYLDRARAYRALGAADRAERDLRAAIDGYERHRTGLASAHAISYFDLSRELFDELTRLLSADPARTASALNTNERSRARELLDRLSQAGVHAPDAERLEPLVAAEIRDALPEGTALVAFAVLDERLVAWLVTRDSLRQESTPVAATRVNALVASLRNEIERRHSRQRIGRSARELYTMLLQPFARELDAAETLIVVPDRSLHHLPFAALIEPRSGAYLVERMQIAVVPSATLFAHASERRRAQSGESGDVLAVGDPAFDPREFPELNELPGARQEAQAVAALYDASRLLLGDEATPSSFLDGIVGASLVHYSGHAVNDVEYPERSRLALAPASPDAGPGALLARDLYGTSLPRTRLVVLAACSTASGKVSRGEGSLSLARPFLAAGVPGVVASLWSIDDAASAEFFRRLHGRLRRGVAVGAALRATQVEMSKSENGRFSAPASWAAFQVFGDPWVVVTDHE